MFSIKFRFIRKISRFVVIHRRNSSINEKIHNNLLPETESQRILKVAIIGMPNAGKSTFINNLMDRKVCPTSSKVHTTRNKSCAIFTEGDAQIVFVDTPGLVNDRELKKYKLAPSFMHDSRTSMDATDMIGVIHDVDNSYMREKLDIKIIKLLQKHEKKRSFLVLNKIDVLKSKRKLLDITRIITENCLKGQPIAEGKHKIELEQKGWRYFSDIFMVSALTGDGLTNVRNYLSQQALPGKWMFPEEVWTDQSPENIIVNTTKAILLNFLPQEMPYLLKVNIEYFEMNDDGVINTTVLVKCPSERIAKFIAGDQQGFLRKIIRTIQENLQNTFRNFVKINIVLDAPKKAEKTK